MGIEHLRHAVVMYFTEWQSGKKTSGGRGSQCPACDQLFFSQLNSSKLITEFIYLFEEAANEIFCE